MTFDASSLITILAAFVGAVIVFYLASLLVHYFTETAKGVTRFAAKLPALNWAALRGLGSVIAALVVSGIVIFASGDTGIADALAKLFSSVGVTIDPTMIKIMATLVAWVWSTYMHDSGKLPTPVPPFKEK